MPLSAGRVASVTGQAYVLHLDKATRAEVEAYLDLELQRLRPAESGSAYFDEIEDAVAP